MAKETPEIQCLCLDIERQFNRHIVSPSDYDQLALYIYDKTHEYVSATTLKRIWGYLNSEHEARHITLSILSRALGYQDWEHYKTALNEQGHVESNQFIGNGIRTADLQTGDSIEVTWQPNRRCVFRYDGWLQFTVTEALNSKLKAGDTFSAMCFFANQPLYIDNLRQGGNAPTSYVAGKQHGLTSVHKL